MLAAAPQSLFLDPSHTYRLDLTRRPLQPAGQRPVRIRPAVPGDEAAINQLYLRWNMVPIREGFLTPGAMPAPISMLVAETQDETAQVCGAVMGVDHRAAFNDPDDGASLWSLAVDPQTPVPGIGRDLVQALAGQFQKSGRTFMDLSVMHDNAEASALYRGLGFEQIPVYCVKRKNPINEKLYTPNDENFDDLNVYARIIVDEARRRGIAVDVEDAAGGLFRLRFGGRAVACREALSELTSAVAMSRCDDKALTRRLLQRAGLRVPAQITANDVSEIGELPSI